MRNRNGFTIAEVLVAVALTGIAVLGTFNVLSYFKLQYNRNFMKIDARLSSTLGERILYFQLKNAYPSFNNMVGDLGKSKDGKNFYDYNPDYPNHLRLEEDQTRKLELKPGEQTETYILVTNPQEGPPLYIDPARLYTTTLGSATADGTLKYEGLMNHAYIKELAKDNAKEGVRSLWQDNNILYFYLPSSTRPPEATDDAFVPPYCFFGRVQGTTLILETFGGRIACKNPLDGEALPDLDTFMRQLPALNGGVPIVLMRSVSLLRYNLVEDPRSLGNYNLEYSKWNGTSFGDPQMAATNILSVTFTRSSVAETVISISVVPKADKKPREEPAPEE